MLAGKLGGILPIPNRGDDDPVDASAVVHKPVWFVKLPSYRVDRGAQHRHSYFQLFIKHHYCFSVLFA